MYAVDAKSGTEQWRYTPSATERGGNGNRTRRFHSPLIVADGTVFARGSWIDGAGWHGPAFLVAVDAETGTERWTFDEFVAPSWGTGPTIVDGAVYLGTNRARLYAVDVATGDRSWTGSDEAGRYGIAGVADGTVVAPRSGGLDWFDATSGTEIEPEIEHPYSQYPSVRDYSSPITVEGTLYHGGVAWDMASGEVLWVHDAPIQWSTLAAGSRYLSVLDRGIVSVETATGTPRWTFDEVDSAGATAVADGLVYVVGDGVLYAIDDDSGTEEWQFTGNGEMMGHPTVYDGLVYAGSSMGSLYAIDAATGNREWTFDTPTGAVGSPTVVADPAAGSSVDRRAVQGPTGHHDDLAHPMDGYEPPLTDGDTNADSNDEAADDSIPGFGAIMGTAGVVAGGYLRARRRNRTERER